MTPNPVVARELESRAAELATEACAIFLRNHAPEDDSVAIQEEWSHHFRQRVLELSAALAAGEATLFTSRVAWSRRALQARLQNHVPIGETLHSLRSALQQQLDADLQRDAVKCIDAALREYEHELPEAQVSRLDPGLANERLALIYLQAALEGNTHQAMQIVLDAIDDGLPHAAAITRVLLPAQLEVGHLWHIDHVTVAEEHLVTGTTVRLMAVIADRAPRARDLGRTAVTASIAGNVHDIGIRAISYLMEMSGWRAIHLGSDVPRTDLPAAVHFFDADIVLLSTALSSQIPRLQESIQAIRDISDARVKVMVGGSAFSDAPDAWQRIGADGYAGSAEQAVLMATELVTGETHH